MACASVSAQSVSEMFIEMPDSMLPYMPKELRKELVGIKRLEPDSVATLSNALGVTKITRFSDEVMMVSLAKNVTMEIGRPDSLHIVVLKTFAVPEQESVCKIYDNEWNEIGVQTFCNELLTVKPDTMTQDRYDELLSMIEFPMVSATFGEDATMLILGMEVPLLNGDDKKKLEAVISSRRLKWTGKIFN